MTKTKKKNRIVVVATSSRPWLLACGRLIAEDTEARTVTLADARCCVHYSAETRGMFGLGSHGPAAGSRVTRTVESVTLGGVEAVIDATPAALTMWEREPW